MVVYNHNGVQGTVVPYARVAIINGENEVDRGAHLPIGRCNICSAMVLIQDAQAHLYGHERQVQEKGAEMQQLKDSLMSLIRPELERLARELESKKTPVVVRRPVTPKKPIVKRSPK